METTPKQKALYIIIIVAVLLAGLSIWYFFFRDDCDPNNKGYTKKGKISDKCFGGAQDPKTITTAPPAGCQWTSDNTFPLKRCMSGNRIKALQTALGISADGKFGTGTESAVSAKFKKNEVSEAEYNNLLNPPASGGGSNFSDLKKSLQGAYENIAGGIKYYKQGANNWYQFQFYTNGRWAIAKKGAGSVLKNGSYTDGGRNMSVDGGATYSTDVYSNMSNIIKTTIGD